MYVTLSRSSTHLYKYMSSRLLSIFLARYSTRGTKRKPPSALGGEIVRKPVFGAGSERGNRRGGVPSGASISSVQPKPLRSPPFFLRAKQKKESGVVGGNFRFFVRKFSRERSRPREGVPRGYQRFASMPPYQQLTHDDHQACVQFTSSSPGEKMKKTLGLDELDEKETQ